MYSIDSKEAAFHPRVVPGAVAATVVQDADLAYCIFVLKDRADLSQGVHVHLIRFKELRNRKLERRC